MVVLSLEDAATSVNPPANLYKSFVPHANSLILKVGPQLLPGSENIVGHGGLGTIKKMITFSEGSEFKRIKNQFEEIEDAKFKSCYSLIEGVPLVHTHKIKMAAAPQGRGSVLEFTSKNHTNASIDEMEIDAGYGWAV